MTRLILVHGINNEDNTTENIRDSWIDAIRAAAGKNSKWAKKVAAAADAPFYGKDLADFAETKANQGTPMGGKSSTVDFQDAIDQALADLDAGKSPHQIAKDWSSPKGYVPQAAGFHKKWLKTAARMLLKVPRVNGKTALRLLKQAHVYVTRPKVRAHIDALVCPKFEQKEKLVIVSHSLGTIVSFSILRALAAKKNPVDAPIFLTLGSPLGIDVIKELFAPPRLRPADVGRWVNGSDPEDFVALFPELTVENFGPGVDENLDDIENGRDDAHSIFGYLSDKRIAKAIADQFP